MLLGDSQVDELQVGAEGRGIADALDASECMRKERLVGCQDDATSIHDFWRRYTATFCHSPIRLPSRTRLAKPINAEQLAVAEPSLA